MFNKRTEHSHPEVPASDFIEHGPVAPLWPAGQIQVKKIRSRVEHVVVRIQHWRTRLDANGKRRLGAVTRKEVPPHLYINLSRSTK